MSDSCCCTPTEAQRRQYAIAVYDSLFHPLRQDLGAYEGIWKHNDQIKTLEYRIEELQKEVEHLGKLIEPWKHGGR
jgi:hypothetical protein